MTATTPSPSLDLTSAPLLEWWRHPNPVGMVESLASQGSARDALRASVACIRTTAIEVAKALDGADTAKMIGSVIRAGRFSDRASRDCLATDLLASALLIEALGGDQAARVAVGYLRRQRSLEPIKWPGMPRERVGGPNEAASDSADELSTPLP